jgi:hypothetical protein
LDQPEKHPIALSNSEARDIKLETSANYRKLSCVFYDDCLDLAEKEDWPGFCCNSCKAFQAIDTERKVLDFIGLLTCAKAVENVNECGKVCRRRGVKPGSFKKKVEKKVEQDEELAPISNAFPAL